MSSSPIHIVPARFPEDAEIVRALFQEYIESLGIDLSFQDVETELATIPGKYASPLGTILLAKDEVGEALGCIAIRPIGNPRIKETSLVFHESEFADSREHFKKPFSELAIAEIKRLYVRPIARGHHLGQKLTQEIINSAKNLGYNRVVLDTLASMAAARKLYASLGFEEIPPYYDNPFPDVIYLGRDL